MKVISNLFSALLLATWVVVTAVIAVQNATGVSLRFLGGQTIQIPVGVLLALAVAMGVLGGAIVPLVWQVTNSLGRKRSKLSD